MSNSDSRRFCKLSNSTHPPAVRHWQWRMRCSRPSHPFRLHFYRKLNHSADSDGSVLANSSQSVDSHDVLHENLKEMKTQWAQATLTMKHATTPYPTEHKKSNNLNRCVQTYSTDLNIHSVDRTYGIVNDSFCYQQIADTAYYTALNVTVIAQFNVRSSPSTHF